jgi:hypothetical protein
MQWQKQLVYRLRWQPCFLNGKITTPGVQLPIRKEVSTDIEKLEEYGVVLKNHDLLWL